MAMRVAFRVDASVPIGVGHVVRCLTLAQELRRRSSEVLFITQGFDGPGPELIKAAGFAMARIEAPDWETDADRTLAVLKERAPFGWLVVDHYGLDRKWEEQIRSQARRLMVIDDLADRPHQCEVLLDQNLLQSLPNRYDPFLPVACKRLLGPHYALIGDAFLQVRTDLVPRKGKAVERVLVSYGGTDPFNATVRALEALRILQPRAFQIEVVIGESNPHRAQVARLCQELPTARLIVQEEKMAQLLARCDLALGAAGSSTWERLCLGLPTLTLSLTPSQEEIALAVQGLGAADHMGKFNELPAERIAEKVNHLLGDGPRRTEMEEKGMALVDGQGARRVVDVLESAGALT